MECLPRFQRRSELQSHLPGDLKQPFDGRDMLVEIFPGRRTAHPHFDLARMLRGEVEHQDGAVDLSPRPRMQAGDARSKVRNIRIGGLARVLTRALRSFPKIDYVQHLAVCRSLGSAESDALESKVV
jgi:hypothetical protein